MLDSLDISILREINVHRVMALDGFFGFITDSGPIIAPCIPLAFILWGIIKKRKEIWMKGFMIVLPYLLSAGITTEAKYLIMRERPFILYKDIIKLGLGGGYSFPSGHTADAFSIAMVVSLLYPKRSVVIPMFLWAMLVAYSRMDLGVHYPTDVIAGAFVGIGSALICYPLLRSQRTKKDETKVIALTVDNS